MNYALFELKNHVLITKIKEYSAYTILLKNERNFILIYRNNKFIWFLLNHKKKLFFADQ